MNILIIGAAGMIGRKLVDAEGLGFRAETSFDIIIRAHIEDELGVALPA